MTSSYFDLLTSLDTCPFFVSFMAVDCSSVAKLFIFSHFRMRGTTFHWKTDPSIGVKSPFSFHKSIFLSFQPPNRHLPHDSFLKKIIIIFYQTTHTAHIQCVLPEEIQFKSVTIELFNFHVKLLSNFNPNANVIWTFETKGNHALFVTPCGVLNEGLFIHAGTWEPEFLLALLLLDPYHDSNFCCVQPLTLSNMCWHESNF